MKKILFYSISFVLLVVLSKDVICSKYGLYGIALVTICGIHILFSSFQFGNLKLFWLQKAFLLLTVQGLIMILIRDIIVSGLGVGLIVASLFFVLVLETYKDTRK